MYLPVILKVGTRKKDKPEVLREKTEKEKYEEGRQKEKRDCKKKPG